MRYLFFLWLSSHALAIPLPQELLCSGTEPFWGLTIKHEAYEFELSGDKFPLKAKSIEGFYGQSAAPGFLIRASKGNDSVTLTFVNAPGCSDGMSEREYSTYVTFDTGKHAYFGCCRATDFKGDFHVVGVGLNDNLNVRKGPGLNFPVFEKLAYNAKGIERVRCQKEWCFVRWVVGKRTKAGWVHHKYISP